MGINDARPLSDETLKPIKVLNMLTRDTAKALIRVPARTPCRRTIPSGPVALVVTSSAISRSTTLGVSPTSTRQTRSKLLSDIPHSPRTQVTRWAVNSSGDANDAAALIGFPPLMTTSSVDGGVNVRMAGLSVEPQLAWVRRLPTPSLANGVPFLGVSALTTLVDLTLRRRSFSMERAPPMPRG